MDFIQAIAETLNGAHDLRRLFLHPRLSGERLLGVEIAAGQLIATEGGQGLRGGRGNKCGFFRFVNLAFDPLPNAPKRSGKHHEESDHSHDFRPGHSELTVRRPARHCTLLAPRLGWSAIRTCRGRSVGPHSEYRCRLENAGVIIGTISRGAGLSLATFS